MHPTLIWLDLKRGISTYSLLVPFGYLAGVAWLRAQLKYHRAEGTEFWGMVGSVLGGAILGGKLGFYLFDPRAGFDGWSTGWVFWSGLVCGIAAGFVYQAWHNRRYRPRAYLPVADYCVAALAIGHIFGRLGCLAQGCCYGRPTDQSWGIMFFDPASSVPDNLKGIPLHPTQLYEVVAEAAAAFVLIKLVLPGIRAARWRYGSAFLGYLLYYSIFRFAVEFFRGDDRGVFLSPVLSPSQWVSLVVGGAVAVILWRRGFKETDLAGRSLFLGAGGGG